MIQKDGDSQQAGVNQLPTQLLKDGATAQVGAREVNSQDSDKALTKVGATQVETAIRVGDIKDGDISERKADL